MYKQIIDQTKEKMEQTVDYLKGEMAKLRVGRASQAMLSDLKVEYYGTKSLLKTLATITQTSPVQMLITPFDKASLKNIEKAISEADLGLSCQNDGEVIRVSIPPLTEERRVELSKILKQKTEETKVSIRNAREEAWKKVKEKESSGELTEDERYRAKDDLDDLAGEYIGKIDKIAEEKKKELMSI